MFDMMVVIYFYYISSIYFYSLKFQAPFEHITKPNVEEREKKPFCMCVAVVCVFVCSGLLLSYLTRSNLYSISTKKENKNEIQCKQSGCQIFPFTWQKEAATGNDKRNSVRAKKNWHRLRCCWHCRCRHYCQDCRPFDTQRHRHTHEKNVWILNSCAALFSLTSILCLNSTLMIIYTFYGCHLFCAPLLLLFNRGLGAEQHIQSVLYAI